MSLTFSMTGCGNTISTEFFPAINLDPNKRYTIALVGFFGSNSIRNISLGNDKFYYNNKVVKIPWGCYEITELSDFLKSTLGDKFMLRGNVNTLKCELSSQYTIDFTKPDSIGTMLGFKPQKLKAGVLHMSDLPVQIMKATSISVDCNLVQGAFRNNKPSHILYETDISVPPGFRLVKEPSSPIYMDINTKTIHSIVLRLVDQNGDLIDLASEAVTVRLELKEHGPKP